MDRHLQNKAPEVVALYERFIALARECGPFTYAVSKTAITLKGTLVRWDMINPHSWFHIEVKSPTGEVVEWMVEGGSPNSLIRVGVTKYTLQIGMELTIEAYQAKDASNTAVGRNFVLPNGKRLFVGSAGGPDAPPATPDTVK